MEKKTISFINKLSFVSLFATVFISIFFFLPYSSMSLFAAKGFFFSIGITISLCFWLVARLGEGVFHIPRDRSVLFGLAIPLIFLISSFFSVSKNLSFFGSGFEVGTFSSMLIMFLVFFLSATYFQTERRLWYFQISLFASAAVLVLFEIILILGNLIKPGIFGNFLRSVSYGNLFGTWTDFAIFFGLIALLCVYTIDLLKSKGIFKFLQYFLLVSSFVFLAIINISFVWILIGIFSVVLLVYSISFQQAGVAIFHGGENKKKFPFVAMISILICFVFIVGGTNISSFTNKYIPIPNIDIRPNISSTSHVAYKAFLYNPVLGTGPNTFIIDWAKWRPMDIYLTPFWNNDFSFGFGFLPTLLSTVGVLGAVAFLIFILSILYRGFKFMKVSYKDSLNNYFLLSLLLTVIYSWIICIIYTPNVTMLMIAFLSSGVLIGMLVYNKSIPVIKFSFLDDPRHSFFSILLLMILIIGTIFLTYTYAKKFVSVMYFAQSVNVENSAEGLDKAVIMQNNAFVLDNKDTYLRSLSQIYLSQIGFILNNKEISADRIKTSVQQLVSQSEYSAKLAVTNDKKQYLNHLNLGNLYASLSQLKIEKSYENSVDAYNKALVLSPNNPNIILSLARLEFSNSNTDKAIEFINQALQIKPNYADALILKAQIFVNQNNIKGAIEQIDTAIYYFPSESNLYFQSGQLRYADGSYSEAVVAFENAVFLNRNNSNARFMLGKAYQKTNSNGKALEQFKILEDIEPENADVKEAIRSISNPPEPVVEKTTEKTTQKN